MKKVSEFKPAWWLSNPHLQTVWSSLARSRPELPLRKERFELPDGDFLNLNWLGEGDGPIVVVLHGLCGSVESPYVSGTLQAIHQSGWRGVLMHFRGCGGEYNRLERSYHAGDTDDIKAFVTHLKRQYPGTPIAAIGYSLGGNVLLKWLGETGDKNPLDAAVAISVPFDLHKVLNRFDKGVSRFYSKHLLQLMQDSVVDKFSDTYSPVNLESVKNTKTFSEFDSEYTAPMHGFASAYDYYERSSSRHYLKSIQKPTLILHAEDDPFMSPDCVPKENELSNHVTLEVSEKGGHVGFVSGKWPWRPEYWIEKRIPQFLKPILR